MVHLKALLEPAQDGDGVLHRRFFHHDGLEAALQRRVFFNILAVLVHGSGADAVQLAARQHGFEQVARVHGAFGFARAHDRVQFVNEENGLPFALFYFIEHGLEAFFKFAPVFGPGDKRAHVQGKELAALQPFGHVALDDAEGKPLDDGRFAHARLADEHGIILGAARKNADNAAYFRIAADDRIHLALARHFHKVAGVLVQGFEGVFGVGAGYASAAAQIFHGTHKGGAGDLVFFEDLTKRAGGRNFGQRGKEVVNADVFVLHALGFILGIILHGSEALGDHDLVGIKAAAGYRRPLAHGSFKSH